MTELLHNATKKLINDPDFLKAVETKMTSIMKDGKITTRDIPDIVLLVVQITSNLQQFNLSYEELGDILEETIMYLLTHFKAIPDDQKADFTAMTHTIIQLVMLQPKVKSCLTNCWQKTSCCKRIISLFLWRLT